MIFNIEDYFFESNKERNFYYKIFAGYIFNEFITGIEKRVEGFEKYLSKPVFKGKNHPESKIELIANKSHVSFDNYINLFDFEEKTINNENDNGEFADILIYCEKSKTIIAIESKLDSNWTFNKDILSNQKRLKKIHNKLPNFKIHPFLLITKNKWTQVKKTINHPESNYKKLLDYNNIDNETECIHNIILWDDLIENVIKNKEVIKFLKSKLENLDYNYTFSDGGLKKK